MSMTMRPFYWIAPLPAEDATRVSQNCPFQESVDLLTTTTLHDPAIWLGAL